MRGLVAILMLVSSLAAAHAFGLGKEGKQFGRLGAISNKKTASAPVNSCIQDGLDFTKACNAVLYVVIY